MPTFKIDGKEITVDPGTTILQAALANGIEIPHYCYHLALTIAGSCRMCLVELEGSPKLVLSCATEVRDDMVVHTQSDSVKDARRSMLEFFLINHPLDCPICDKAGECLLQDYTYQYGSSHSRMREEKRVRPTKDLGGNILLYRNRCVMCTRCVRFFEDVVGEPLLAVEHRGYHSDISIFPDKGLIHKMTGNIVEICPVGCLIDKDFLFHARVWNLDKTRSICPGCSSGCNINLEHKDNKIFRIRSRENTAVNTNWICDDGRYIYHRYEELERITRPMINENGNRKTVSWKAALARIKEHFDGLKHANELDRAAIVGSASATNEENYLLSKIFGETIGCKAFYTLNRKPEGEDVVYKDGFTIRADKSTNHRGAKLLLGEKTDFWQAIEKGKVKTLVVLNHDVDLQLSRQQAALLKKLDMLIVLDMVEDELVRSAAIALPIGHFAETDGTFINVQGRLQRLNAALTPPGEAKPGWQVLLELYRLNDEKTSMVSAADVMSDIAAKLSPFKGISYFKLADSGIKII